MIQELYTYPQILVTTVHNLMCIIRYVSIQYLTVRHRPYTTADPSACAAEGLRRSLAGIAGSNPAGGVDVCVL
jgi:hypothetical protein